MTMKTFFAAFLAVFMVLPSAVAAPTGKAKCLVLDPITYQKGVDKTAFSGIDELLLTKLVQAKKYKCLDRDAYETAAREEGFGAQVELIPAGYSMRGEIVQMQRSGNSRSIGGSLKNEYVATVSIRANDLRTQEAYEAETLRVTAYCQTPKDMLVHVVQRVALAILIRDYPLKIMDIDDGELTLNYGSDFLNVGEQYEVRKLKKIIDEDTGNELFKEKTVGVCEITSVGRTTAVAQLISGQVGESGKYVLRFYDNAESFTPPPAVTPAPTESSVNVSASPFPRKVPRIAIAPFISKRTAFNVWGSSISARDWLDDTATHLNTVLTQSGSFKVLDRSFGNEIDRELNRIANDPNSNPNDICRLSQKLATDYLVVAEVVFTDVASPGVNFVTGLPLPPASTEFAEVRFRCVVAPTTEIKVADTVRVQSPPALSSNEQFISQTADDAAHAIASTIQKVLK